jgi:hypothetical protein
MKWLRAVVLLPLLAAACSLPNLEGADCSEARTSLREFYSFHFGGDMVFSADRLAQRERFLTPEFAAGLRNGSPEGVDVFTTGTADLPKAFRVGACRAAGPDEVEFRVLLFWKDDVRSEQREIGVRMEREDGRWLVSAVDN